MKSPLLIIATLVVIVLFTALIGPFFVDWAKYRTDIEEYGRQITGREVKVGGDIDIRLLPLPKLTLGDVSIANIENAQAGEILSAKKLDARLSLTPLLRGKLQVTSIELESPTIDLERGENGSGNWWLTPTVDLGDVMKIDDVALEAVRLVNATIILRDRRRGGEAQFEDGNLTISAGSLSGPVHVRGQVSYDNEPIDVAINSGKKRPDGSLRLHVRLKPKTGLRLIYNFDGQLKGGDVDELAEGKFRIAPAPVDDSGKGDQLAVFERLPFDFSSRVKIYENRIAFQKINFALDKKNQVTNAFTGRAQVSLSYNIALLGEFEARRIDIDAVGKMLGQNVAGEIKKMLTLEAVEALVDGMPEGVNANVSLQADQVVSDGNAIENARIHGDGTSERFKLNTLQGVLPGRAKFRLSGLYLPDPEAPQFNGEIGIDAIDGKTLLNWFRPGLFPEGEGNIGRLTLGGQLTATPEQVRISEGQFSYDGGEGQANLNWQRANANKIAVSLAAQKINLNPLVSADRGIAGAFGFVRGLAGADADVGLDLKADEISFGKHELSVFAADLIFAPGAIEIKQLSAGLPDEGSFRLSGQLSGLPEHVRGLVSGTIVAPNGKLIGDVMGNAALPEQVNRFLTAGPVELAGEFEAGENETRIELSGNAGGGALNASLISDGELSGWKTSELALRGDFATKNANPLMSAFGVEPTDAPVPGKAELSAAGMLSKELQISLSGELFGATFDAGGTATVADEQVSGNATLGLDAKDGSRFLAALGLEGAEEQPLLVSAKMFARKNAVEKTNLEANFVLGKNRGVFSGSVGMSGERAKASGNVAMSYLDLPSIAGTLLLEKKKGNREGAWSNRLFRRDALSRFDGDLSVKSDEMKLSEKLVLSDASFLFTSSAGALEISALNGKPGKGTFDGAFKLSAGDVAAQEFSATFSLEKLDLDPWLKNEKGRALGSGTVSLNGNLKASGRSPAGLVSDLSGAGNWSLAAAQVFGIDPVGFSSRLKEAGKTITIDDLIAKRLKKGRLSVGPAKGAWRVQAGLLRTDPVKIESKSAAATFSVFADLPARKIDASWSLKLPSDPELPDFVIALAGPFGNLGRAYDTSALKSFLVVRELEQGVDKLEELQAEQQRIYEEQKRLEEEEEARRIAEEARKEAERQARLRLEEEARRKAEQAEQEERLREEQEARRQLEEELKRLEAEQERSKQETSLQDAKEQARRAKQQEQQKQKEWLEFLDETARTEDRNAVPQENVEQPLPLDTAPSAQSPTVISPPASQTVIRKVLPPIEGVDKK